MEKIIKPYLNYTDQKMAEFRTGVMSFADSVVDFSSFEQAPGITNNRQSYFGYDVRQFDRY